MQKSILYLWILKVVKHQLVNLKDKTNFKRSHKYVALSHLSMYYRWKNIKNSYKNNKFKISAPLWNEEFELTDGSYFASDTQDYVEHILKEWRKIDW